jgi:hypothetical protein
LAKIAENENFSHFCESFCNFPHFFKDFTGNIVQKVSITNMYPVKKNLEKGGKCGKLLKFSQKSLKMTKIFVFSPF